VSGANPEAFASLLTLFMRRIRASAAGVAAEVGLSREAVNNWRNGVSLPNPRSRDKLAACARYLRLTEGETNRLFAAAGCAPEYPLHSEHQGRAPFAAFMERLLTQLAQSTPYPITLLLSQAHWGQPPFRQELLLRAKALYGADAVLHLQPPYSTSVAPADYFAALGRQCGLGPVDSDCAFEALLEQRLLAGERLFCLVSRFEQGTPALREALAGILRSLGEMHGSRLHLLLCGGEALADLKYRSGDLSLLNIAQVQYWPEPELDDLALMAGARAPDLDWPAALLRSLLSASGGHPALLDDGLQHLAATACASEPARLQTELAASPRLWQSWLALTQHGAWLPRLQQLLQASALGPARPYLQDDLLRALFWANLVQARPAEGGAQLHWRSEIVREAGLAVLQAATP